MAQTPSPESRVNTTQRGRFTIPHLRWWIAGLLFLVTVLNYFDRQTLSVLAPTIRDEFRMSNQNYAFILNCFLGAYMIMQPVTGFLLDRLGTRWGFALMFVWWSTATALHRWAQGVWSFALFRFLLGMGEAGNWPGATKAIAEWFARRERAFAMGIFNSGSSTGALLAPPLIAWITYLYGWRNAFLIAAVGGFVWLFFWLALFRNPQEHPWVRPQEVEALASDPDQQAGARAQKIPWVSLLRYREVWGIVVARCLADPVWWFYVFWMFEYLKRERGFTLMTIGKVGWIPFLTADLGCLVGGGLSSYLIRRGWSTDRARKTVMVPSALMMSGAVLVVHTQSAMVALALISLATFAHQSWSTNMLTLPADLFSSHLVASVSGLSGFGAALGGFMFQWLTGYLLDHFSYAPVFALAGMMHPLAALILLTVVRRIRQLETGDCQS